MSTLNCKLLKLILNVHIGLGKPRDASQKRDLSLFNLSDIMMERTYLAAKNLKRKNIAITDNSTATQMKKSKEAREIYDFKNVWSSDGKILFKDGSGNTSLFYY